MRCVSGVAFWCPFFPKVPECNSRNDRVNPASWNKGNLLLGCIHWSDSKSSLSCLWWRWWSDVCVCVYLCVWVFCVWNMQMKAHSNNVLYVLQPEPVPVKKYGVEGDDHDIPNLLRKTKSAVIKRLDKTVTSPTPPPTTTRHTHTYRERVRWLTG